MLLDLWSNREVSTGPEDPLTKLLAKDGEGERLDRYELIAELASGGMATVFLARLLGVAGFQRLVAIKRLHPHLANEKEFVEMFLDEARLAARIHHSHVVPILEVGESDKGYYLVMEYIEGDTMARLFAKSAQASKRVPVDIGIRIVLDALHGLHAAHELKDDNADPLGIVHRDVSPQNILVGIDGIARLTDFGVAKATSRLATTRSGQLKGKLSYMAPEQARGEAVDRRADVFAMGIVLWETLAFKRLFKGEGEADTLNRVLYDPIPAVRSVAPTVPASLEAVAMKALERDRNKRWSSAAEFADALEKAALTLRQLASPKEVAACLDSVMGTDLSQNREELRVWLARSEPSRASRGVGPMKSNRPPPVAEAVTKVESARSSRSDASDRPERIAEGARSMGPDGSGSQPGVTGSPAFDGSQLGSGRPEGIPRIPMPAPLPKLEVSSVSAVVQAPHGAASGAPVALPPAPDRARTRLLLAVAALFGVLLLAGWGTVRWRETATGRSGGEPEGAGLAPSAATAAVPTTSATAAPASIGTTTANAGEPTASAAPSESSEAAPETSALPVGKLPIVRLRPPPTGNKSGTRPDTKQSAPTSTVPDDISKNPYRQ